MSKLVQLVRCNEGEELYDLTIGNTYVVQGEGENGVIAIIDDAGDPSELYEGEYEVVEDIE
jgi:hypothetical protein